MISFNDYIKSFIKCTYGKAQCNTIHKVENALTEDPKLDFQRTLLSDIKSYNYALAQRGCYSDILWIMHRFLNSKSQYEIDQYRKLLPKHTIGVTNLSLDTLCAMFGNIMQELYESMFERFDYSDCSPLLKDKFSDEELLCAYEYNSYANSHNNSLLNEVTKLMPLFISKYIYGIDFSGEKITAESIDRLYAIIINLRKEYIQSENKKIDESNAKQEQFDRSYFEKNNKHRRYGLTLHIKPDKYYDERELLGVFLDFIKIAYLDHNYELCFYIFNQYVLPIFEGIDWESISFSYIDSKLFFEYFSYIQSILIDKNMILWNDNLALKPNGAELIKDLYRSDTHFKNDGKTILGSYTRMGFALSKVFYSGKTYLRESFPQDTWNDFLTLIPYIEMCNGSIAESRNFICDTFSEINTQNRIQNYYVTTIIHCILSSKHVKECQQVYNCFVILSMQLQENKQNAFKLYCDMVTFLEEAKNDIIEKQASTYDTGELWSNLLFADGLFDKKIQKICHGIERMKDNNVLDPYLHKELIKLVAAFSNSSGVRLEMLALPRQDNYDKLPNAVTEEIRRKGERLLKKDNSIKALQRVSNNQYEYQYLDFLSQTHLKELEKKEMSNTLNSIAILKNLYSDEELMNNLNTMIDSLSSQLLYDRLRRSSITDKLLQIQNSFYDKYVPDFCKLQLCEGLPINIQQTVINYLVTSETVYEFLSSRKDRAQNDYSAALISLTKAVELILNYAISKMQISFDKSLPSLVKSQIFDKTVQKSHLALGPCIICIKGCEDINVNINQNKHIHLEPKNEFVFTLNGQATTVTDAWGIDDVFSFEKLKLFKGLQITIDKERENISSETAMAFSDNSKHNKLLFIKSLEHLKDHYRNPIAHKDPIDDNKVIACRKILIEGEYILWILIYLISHSF